MEKISSTGIILIKLFVNQEWNTNLRFAEGSQSNFHIFNLQTQLK